MEIKRALELLRQYRDEIPCLKTLAHGNEEYPRWKNKVNVVAKDAFGNNSEEYLWLYRPYQAISYVVWTDTQRQDEYLADLDSDELAITKILDKYEILGIPFEAEAKEVERRQPPKAFVAHGGQTLALDKLKRFLDALGVIPIIAEEQPSEGRSINENVELYLNRCDCAIILATKGDIDSKTGGFIPRGNILIEVGRCQERFPSKTIYLLEEGAIFPSNIGGKVWEHFSQDNMESAFNKTANELRAFGLIRAVKAEQ